MNNKNGFTIVEIIAALMLMSILAISAGFFIIQGVKGALLTQQNNNLTDKARLTLRRLTLELQNAIDIVSVNPSDATAPLFDIVRYKHADSPDVVRSIGARRDSNPAISITTGTETRFLTDRTEIAITALDTTTLEIVLTVKRQNTSFPDIVFTTVVYPRNRR